MVRFRLTLSLTIVHILNNTLTSYRLVTGRIIKNIVRTAQSLSRSQGVALSERHLDVVIKANEAFVRDYKEADEAGVYEVKGEG
jgi:hypothetical protein